MNALLNEQTNQPQTNIKNPNVDAEKEPEESTKNSERNPNQQERMDEESSKVYEVEISYNNNPDKHDIFITMCNKVIKLLNKWIEAGDIDRVHEKDH